jgi:hypothetical protein
MAKLTTKARNKLPSKDFAGPDRSYPIPDRSHAANALARVSQHGTPAEKKEVRAAVHKKYPTMGKTKQPSEGKPHSGEQSKSPSKRKGHASGPHAEGVPGYQKPEHHTDMIQGMEHDGPMKADTSGYDKPEHHERSGMSIGAPHHIARPVVGAHGFGHGAHQRHGHLRMSGHKAAHRLGHRK